VISRFQTILFAVLLLASAVMGVALWQLREHAHQRMLAGQDSAPTLAPAVAPSQQATLVIASDADNSLLSQVQSLPLPQDPGSQARVILGKLLDIYAAPDAAHPVPGGANSIAQVFLLPALASNVATTASLLPQRSPENDAPTGPELAVVDLTGAFVAAHPSGLETENLTLLSICATLHANLPLVTQVRFLVDGAPRTTLAGHADLTRTYLTAGSVPSEGAHP
jgi:hypothetical protein